MTKKICIISFFVLAFILNANAEQTKEKVVTNKWSFVTGDAIVVNHYLTNHEYKGGVFGFQGEHGTFYKKSDNLSWDLDISFITSPVAKMFESYGLPNPTGTTFYALYQFNTEYGTYYNWNPVKNLYIKAGGVCDLMIGMGLGQRNSINNVADLDLQTQIKAAAGVKYGWDFKSWGLGVRAELAIPFIGFASGGNKYQNSMGNMSNDGVLKGNLSPIYFTSFHNLQGFNTEFGIDFVFKKLTWFIDYEINNRWWAFNDVQNYRKYALTRVGISVDLVSRSRHKSNNRHF